MRVKEYYNRLMEEIENSERGYEPMFDDIDLYTVAEERALQEEIKSLSKD